MKEQTLNKRQNKNKKKPRMIISVELELKKLDQRVVHQKVDTRVLEDLKRCHITEKTEVQEVVTH